MNKPAALREAIRAALVAKGHDVALNPDRMALLIQAGSVHSMLTEGLAFQYAYTVELILLDFPGHPDDVMAPLLLWIRQWQPELMANRDSLREGLTFSAEHLGDDKVDLMIQVKLTERCRITSGPEALPVEVEHLDHAEQPEPTWGLLHQVDANGVQVAHCTAHADA